MYSFQFTMIYPSNVTIRKSGGGSCDTLEWNDYCDNVFSTSIIKHRPASVRFFLALSFIPRQISFSRKMSYLYSISLHINSVTMNVSVLIERSRTIFDEFFIILVSLKYTLLLRRIWSNYITKRDHHTVSILSSWISSPQMYVMVKKNFSNWTSMG